MTVLNEQIIITKRHAVGRLSLLNLLGLYSVVFSVLWPPLCVWIFGFDAAGRISFLLLFVFLCVNWKEIRKWSLLPPVILYSFITVYMIVNGLVMNSAVTFPRDGNWMVFSLLLKPIMVMLIVVQCARKCFDQTLLVLMRGLFIYCILALVYSSFNDTGRLNSELDANEMALHGAIAVGSILLLQMRGKLNRYHLFFAIIIPVLLVVLTGSRMGFAMIVIMLFGSLLLKFDHSKIGAKILFVFVFVLFFLSVYYVLNNTLLGERMLSTTEQHENMNVETGTFFDFLGDRGYQYYFSWHLFLKHPIFGIGFHKWIVFNPLNHVCHSEFLVQYLECGLVSFIPWCFFWLIMTKQLFRIRKQTIGKKKIVSNLILFVLSAMLFADLVLWSYNQICVFVMYAIAIAYPKTIETRKIISI